MQIGSCPCKGAVGKGGFLRSSKLLLDQAGGQASDHSGDIGVLVVVWVKQRRSSNAGQVNHEDVVSSGEEKCCPAWGSIWLREPSLFEQGQHLISSHLISSITLN